MSTLLVEEELRPALVTPRSTDRTEGPRIAEFMERIGTPLLEWQREFLDLAMEIGEDGLPARRTVGLVVARQNGKTWLGMARMLYAAFTKPRQTLVYTTQAYAVALEVLRTMDAIIRGGPLIKHVKVIRYAHGDEAILFDNGSRITVRTRTRQNARGLSGDCVILDEALELRDPDFLRNLSPLLTARKGSQLWYMSSPGDIGSYDLLALRERAQKAVADPGSDPRLAYVEFSSGDFPVHDRRGWGQANPSIGSTITEESLEDELLRLGEERFRVEHLGHWLGSKMDSLVAPETWAAAAEPDLKIPQGADCWLGLDQAPSGSDASLVAVFKLPDGMLALQPVKRWIEPSQADLLADVKRIYRKAGAKGLAYDPWVLKFVAETLEDDPQFALESIGGMRFANGCSAFARLVADGKLRHPNDEWLNLHIGAAVRTDVSDGAFRISRRKSRDSITAAIASVNAVAFASGKQPEEAPRWLAF